MDDPNLYRASDSLTHREKEILRLMADGLSNKAIADQLFISPGTVKWYLKQVYSKLQVNSRTQAIAAARDAGLLGEQVESTTPTSSALLSNLPYQSTPFVGRASELATIAERLADPVCRLLSLVGPGGVGKTRLALEAAVAQTHRFRAGVYFAALAPLADPNQIPSVIAEAIGLSFVPGQPQKEQLFYYLRTRQLLLVLDNFEHLLEAVNLVADLLQHAPGLKLVVTSRERLQLQSEFVLRLDGFPLEVWLSPDDAALSGAGQLFLQSAQRVLPSFTVTQDMLGDLRSICLLVGGAPLGILLAAGWVDVLTVAEIARELERSFTFLEASWRDLPERQRSLRAVFDHSWRLLTDAERSALAYLSVFRGGFTPDAAQQVAGANLKMLTGLANKSLLSRDHTGRFGIHELLRQYSAETLALSPSEEQTAQERHSAYFADFMQRLWRAQRSNEAWQAVARIESEIDNVRVAWNWMVQHSHLTFLKKTAHSLGHFLMRQFWDVEAVAMFGRALTTVRAYPVSLERDATLAIILAWYAHLLFYSDAHPREKPILQECIALFSVIRDAETIAVAYWQLCLTALVSAEFSETKRLAEEGLTLLGPQSDVWAVAMVKYWHGSGAYFLGENDEALRIGREALSAAYEANAPYLQAMIHGQVLGFAVLRAGDYEEAKRQFQHALDFHEMAGSKSEAAMAQRDVVAAYVGAGDLVNATKFYQSSMKIFYEHGYRKLLVSCLIAVAKVEGAQNNHERAVEFLSLVIAHPDTYSSDRVFARDALTQVRDKLSPDSFDAAYRRGAGLDLDVVVTELLQDN